LVNLKDRIREIPDFPKKGILFRDVTTLLLDADAFRRAVDEVAAKVPLDVDKIAGIESRGFVLAAAVAYKLHKGLVLIRKPGKLPGKTLRESYELEYGTDVVEMHADAVSPGEKVALVDDLIATGGTAEAACKLIERAGGKVVGAVFLMELAGLRGAERLAGRNSSTIVRYEGV